VRIVRNRLRPAKKGSTYMVVTTTHDKDRRQECHSEIRDAAAAAEAVKGARENGLARACENLSDKLLLPAGGNARRRPICI